MFEENEAGFVLRGPGDVHPVLAGVRVEGRLDGPLFMMSLRQTYRNLSGQELEVAYSFPLPHGAVVLGLMADRGGRQAQARVLARPDAERLYEAALADGDLPILLEAGPGGVHTASVGSLQPGEQIELELRTASWLAFEAGRLRLSLPTTLAPRAGSSAAAGLLPHQVPPVSMQADYPLELGITVGGLLVSSSIECPTHAMVRAKTDAGVQLSLPPSARLDRDVVLLVTPRQPQASMLLLGLDGPGHVAIAAFRVPPGLQRPRIVLHMLVDCSGSMAGDGIESARQALASICDQLRPGDSVGLSRFGNGQECLLEPGAVDPARLRRLKAALQELRADMGGTALRVALDTRFAGDADGPGCADVLLITDGQVWGTEPPLHPVRTAGHRLFAIGVGSAPAEGVLRDLATASGGACEMVTPGEALVAAAQRMLARIRQQPWTGLRVDWGRRPAWTLPLPAGAFGSDTLLASAGFDGPAGSASAVPARLSGVDALGAPAELARTEAAAWLDGDTLARMAAAQRLAGGGRADPVGAALHYQLLTPQTPGLSVHARPDRGPSRGGAGPHRVSTMLSAGWGGLGSVHTGAPPQAAGSSVVDPPPAAGPTAAARRAVAGAAALAVTPPASLREVMVAITEHLAHGGSLVGLLGCCAAFDRIQPIEAAMHRVLTLRLSPAAAWLLLGTWVASRGGHDGDAASAALLAPHASFIDVTVRRQALALFEQRLGRFASDHWSG